MKSPNRTGFVSCYKPVIRPMEINYLVRVSARMDFSAASKQFIVCCRLFSSNNEFEAFESDIWPYSSVRMGFTQQL